MTRIVVFSGGRGTRYMQEALSGVDCEVTFLINGYDSGLSTGRIRWAFDGMLGPSDFRKCIVTALAHGDSASRATGRLLENRQVTGEIVAGYRDRGPDSIMDALATVHPELAIGTLMPMLVWLRRFLESEPVTGCTLALDDMPLGNALLAGAYLEHGADFNSALGAMQAALIANPKVSICNVTRGDDLWLAARTDTHLTVDEGSIVGEHPPGPITELLLLPRATAERLWERYAPWAHIDHDAEELITRTKRIPEISPEAARAIQCADLIVYGSGTQHSSILPSFLTRGLCSAIAANNDGTKLLFINGTRDFDFHASEGPQELLDKARTYLTAEGQPFSSLVSGVYAATLDWDPDHEQTRERTLDTDGIPLTNAAHSVLDATDAYGGFAAALGQALGHVIAPSKTVVSVIVPVLNEIGTLPLLLKQMETLTQVRGLAVERVFVDGGSTDGSWELIRDTSWVASFQADGRKGRAACIFEGLLRSRGERVCIFHADLEYELRDIANLVGVGLAYPEALVFGSRSHGAASERDLHRMYAGRNVLYWTSRLGAIAVAALLSLRLGRMIGDPFCGLFAGRREVMRGCLDARGGIDSNVRMMLRARREGYQLVEVGVGFCPRTREAGKKTTVGDGLRAIASAVLPIRGSAARKSTEP